jgi:glutamine amidotransferase
VGNFSAASRNIEPYKPEIIDFVESGVSLLGICLGMQLLFTESTEGEGKGLNLLKGKVVSLPSSVKIPHMGWNTLHIVKRHGLLDGVDQESFVYFVHSYYPTVMNRKIVMAETTYGVTFPSIVAERNVYGMQFHPEKSGETGMHILKNFLKTIRR